MPRWKVTVADVITIEVDAETEDEAAALAKENTYGIFDYDEQRVLHIQRVVIP